MTSFAKRTIPLILIAILLASVMLIAYRVTRGTTIDFDQAFLLSLREPGEPTNPIGPEWLEEIARDVTALGGIAVLTILTTLVTLHLVLRGRWRMGVFVAVAAISGTLISNLLKSVFDRPRPELTAIMEFGGGSFPSGHSTVSAVVYLTLGVILSEAADHRRLKVFYVAAAILLTGIVGLSRLYLGVHFPTDVAAGWAIGAAWALACATIASYLKQRRSLVRFK
jgi:undecaprenyl-diphosphatase